MARGKIIPGWRPELPPFFKVCNAILAGSGLSQSARAFLEDVRHARRLTPKQQRYLNLIIDRTLRNPPQHKRRSRYGHTAFDDDLDDEIRF